MKTRAMLLTTLLAFSVFSQNGCALLGLPMALVGGVLAIVQIPINLALSLVGPATNAAAIAAPYALLFARRNPESKPVLMAACTSASTAAPRLKTAQCDGLRVIQDWERLEKGNWDLVILRKQEGESETIFHQRTEAIARGPDILSASYVARPHAASNVSAPLVAQRLRHKGVRCYVAEI